MTQVIDSVPAMISATDEEGRILFVNAHFAEFVNTSPKSLLRRHLHAVLLSDNVECSEQVHKAVLGKQRASSSFEERIFDSTGSERAFLTTKTSLRELTGGVTGVLTTSIDITDRKQAENKTPAHRVA